VEVLGSLDELDAWLGLVRSTLRLEETNTLLLGIQRDLYGLMSAVAAGPEMRERFPDVRPERTAFLEERIEHYANEAGQLDSFVIPGDDQRAAFMDITRTVVRRAERRLAELLAKEPAQTAEGLRYLNRLSSLCFVLEVWIIRHLDAQEPTQASPDRF
jgi:cob(I)alamin adenosyltransferase